MGIARIILLMVSMLVIAATTVDSQSVSALKERGPKSNTLISKETYNHVLDILFPRDEPAKNYLLALRFGPSFHPESQIVIKGGGEKVQVIEYTSLSGNIYSKLNEFMSHGGIEDAVAMANLIKVRRRSIEVPYSKAKQWHSGFLDSLAELSKSFQDQTEQLDKDGTITVTLDGTLYEFWYSQSVSKTSFSVWDEEVSGQQPNGQLIVVQWMNRIRHEVEKLKQ